MISFNPQREHYPLKNTGLATYEDFETDEPLPFHVAQLHAMLRSERDNDIFPDWHRRRFAEGDLVLVRYFQKEKHKGKKFGPRWTGPQVAVGNILEMYM